MEFKQINETCYYFESAVNIGYVHHQEEGMLIDSGIDKSSIKKVLRILDEKKLPVTHLFVTHAHSDHYGGAHALKKDKNIEVIAPVLEGAILENPMLEPLYLFGGNDPLPELRNKFLEGKPVQVDYKIDEGKHQFSSFHLECILLPGHSYYQLGVIIDNVFFTADAYFGKQQLKKHKIPYITDADTAIKSLKKAMEVQVDGALPGHGTFEANFQSTIEANIAVHEKILEEMSQYIKENPGVSHEELVSYFCHTHEVHAKELSQLLLYRTAVTAYLTGLIKRVQITYKIVNYKWTFYPAS